MTKHCRNYRICWQKKIDLSYSNPGGTLENKLNDLIPLLSRKKSFGFQILLTRLNNNHSMRVMYHKWPLSMKQTFDRHMTTLFEEPSQSVAAFAGKCRFSKSRGLSASVSFLPLPSPLFHFLALISFLARPKPVFLCSKTKWKRLLRRLH